MENEVNTRSIQESLSNLTIMHNQELDPSIPSCKELPIDIISFIIYRLPVKSLVRFKCVSKPWLSLISSPHFTKKHLLANISEEKRKIMWSVKGKYMDSFCLSDLLSNDFVEPRLVNDVSIDAKFKKGAKIIGSSNGLICVFVPPKLVILWNPSIKKRSIVPDFGVSSDHDKRRFGLGYDKDTNDYKIVGFFGIAKSHDDLFVVVKVFSFKTGEWKRIKSHKCCAGFYNQDEIEISFANGKFYWINTVVGNWAVHSLDLATEKYQSFEIPLRDMRMNCTMAISEQGLVYVLGCRDSESLVWVMKEEGNSKKVVWTKVCSIDYAKVHIEPNAMFVFNSHLFDVLVSGEIMIRLTNNFLVYSPKDGSMKFRYVDYSGNGIDFGASNFVESLVWV